MQKNGFPVNSQNLLYTIFCESTVCVIPRVTVYAADVKGLKSHSRHGGLDLWVVAHPHIVIATPDGDILRVTC